LVAIHQFLANLTPHDAIGDHCLAVRDTLRGAGYRSDIYAHEYAPQYRVEAQRFTDFDPSSTDEPTWLLFHASIGTPVARFLRERPEPLIVNYHNITPATFFMNWEPRIAAHLAAGRRQLASLAPRSVLGLAVSEFNRGELEALSYAPTDVVPILFDVSQLDAVAPDPSVAARLRAEREMGGADWLFVGRIAPNKAQHDIVKAFAAYRRFFDPQARLRLVGNPVSHLYGGTLEKYVAELGLSECVDLAGGVSESAKRAYFEHADAFVVCSEHEGFCVPLLEAMHHRLPIVAYGAAAIPETLGDAGLVLDTKRPFTVAAAVARVLGDGELRAGMVEAGTRRLAHYDVRSTRAQLLRRVEELVTAA
jgi:glycosyltransferase involved in cell wall biosynthesis